MATKDQLRFCEICKNQKFDFNQGIICGLTNESADFKYDCNFFILDAEKQKEVENNKQAEQRNINEEFVVAKTYKSASKGKRFANYIIDLIFLFVFNFIAGIFLGFALALISPSSLSIFQEDNILVNYSFGFVCGMIYYTFFESLTGRSLAKFITGTKVVTEDGEKPSFGTILKRSLCRFIPFEAFSFFGSDDIGWHDSISKTRVVEV